MEMKEIVLLTYGLFAGHSLFLASWLFLKHKHSGNRLLGLILLLLTLRVGKSILSLAIFSWAIPVNVIGLAAMAALGPFALFYMQALFCNTSLPLKKMALHLVPAFICLGAWRWTLINPAYYVITAHLFAYLVYTASILFRNSEKYVVDNIRWRWSKYVLAGLFAITVSFGLQLFLYAPVLYLANIGISVLVLYLLSWWAVNENKLFVESTRKSTEAEPEAYTELGVQIKKLMDEEVFIEPDLNLSKLARRLNVQPYRLSKAINVYFNNSFPELILSYRIRKAEQLLTSFSKFYTIEAIAYESGFNTLSVFYLAFKKAHGMTPAQYRKHQEANGSSAEIGNQDHKGF
jgi:AraC-like DNA-binding protein